MLLASNRNIQEEHFKDGIGDAKAFGEEVNTKGPNELRFARVTKPDGKWQVRLVEEPAAGNGVDDLPSQQLFKEVQETCAREGKNCLLYIHGYNKPFEETLEQGWFLQEKYNLEVVLFSWPSNTGGIPVFEYREARRNAQASFGAMDALLEKFGFFLHNFYLQQSDAERNQCKVSVNLMAHSLGNYLLENYIRSAAYQQETRIFTNLIMSAADVNSDNHALWVDSIVTGQRIYVTINEYDTVLKVSQTINPPRLGKTLANLNARNASYFDFTNGQDVGVAHPLWLEAISNVIVRNFFQDVFNGQRGEDAAGFHFDARLNAFRIQRPPRPILDETRDKA